ncbi:MAG: phospholipid carrier-dependent glycosyltransferase [Clostridiales bacterium]|nr:phospholipid carrier-dependent glycosyltransferase [Clostridiales bacterium]
MRKLLTILLLLCLLCVPALALADGADELTGDELIYNGDFSAYVESAALPSGWELSAYQNDADGVSAALSEDEDGTRIVSLTNLVANDSRLIQPVSVLPDTVYRLSADIRTSDVEYGTGANLSIDNYPLDGTYCYSENLFGSDAWRSVSLYFRTGAEQTTVNVALRLGGYGTTAVGTAEYRNVSMYVCTATDATIVDLPTENGTVSGSSGASEAAESVATANDPLYLAIAFTVALVAVFVWIYRHELRYEDRMLESVGRTRLALMIILIGAFVFRVALSIVFYGHPTDINCFMSWGNMVLDGTSKFYTSGAFTDYPPGYMYVCGGLSAICKALGILPGSDGMALLFKMPSTFADMATAYLLYLLAKENGLGEKGALLIAGVFAFCPPLMFVSGAWGQIDSLLALLLALVIWLLQKEQRILAGAIYGLAILLKPQALMLGPIFAVAFIAQIFDGKGRELRRLGETALAVFAACTVLLVLSLPFKGSQSWDWLIRKYAETAGSYHYASIEAFNFASLLGWNWKTADVLILGIPYALFGSIMIGVSVAFSSTLYLLGRKRSRGALYLAGALVVLLIFAFGHYMHERYMLPALLLLLVAYLYYRDRRLLIAFGGMAATAFLNAACAYYVVNHTAARGSLYEVITFFGSLSTVAFAFYLSYLSVQILALGRVKEPLEEHLAQPKRLPRRVSILPKLPTDNKLHYTKRDMLYVLGITLVYGVVALTNLGSTSAPQTYWYSDKAGESVTIRFDAVEHVAAYSVFGNIDNDGTLLIATPDGHEEVFDQTYDDMFRWKKVSTDFVTNTVTLSLYSGSLKLNEIAFFDQNGAQIPLHAINPEGTQANLVDEQDTVAATPSYYNGMYFDELYHGRTAYEHLHNLAPYENSHPPLGKLFIMLGVWAFGMTPFGWRVVGALFGIGMLPVLYAFGKRIFKDSNYALVLTTLFAFDFMHFTQTRIATIDVYSVFFILLMYYYMYQYITMNFFVDGLKKTLKPLALSGLFFGIGAACKWTSIYAGAGLAVLLFGSLIARYLDYVQANARDNDADKACVKDYWRLTVKTLAWCVLFFIVIPFAIYFASYTPYYIYESGQNANYGLSGMKDTFVRYQQFMYNYHSNLKATHPYQSSWYSWPFTIKPMWYYFNSYIVPDEVSTLSASGNPAVWWVSALGAAALLWARVSKRVAPDRAMQIFCVGVLANYLPWVLVTRCTFIYHFFATVPFILMATVYALQKLEQKYRDANFIKWVWIGFALLFFILLYPGLSGLPVSAGWASFLSKLPGGKLMYGA